MGRCGWRFGRMALLAALLVAVLGGRAQAVRLNDAFLTQVPRLTVGEGKTFSFAYIGDVQINFGIFHQALQDMRQDPEISFLIVGGDAMAKATKEGFEAFLARVRGTPFPVVAVPGNHDLYGDSEAVLFRKYVGDGVTPFVVGESAFLLLQNTTGKFPREVERQFRDLVAVCAKNPRIRHVFVVMHVPPFDPRTNAPGHSMSAKAARKFFDLVEPLATPERSVTVLCSHVHGCFFREHGAVRVVVSGGGGGGLYGKGPEFFHHYMKVEVRGNELRLTPVRIEKKSRQ